MPTNYHAKNPRGQQRDKIYREALRLELADMSEGVDLKKLRQIARAHIEKAASGDMQAIRNWLTGWMAGRRRSSSTAAPTATRSPRSSARSSTSICRLRNSQHSMRPRNSQRSLCRLNGIERMEAGGRMWIPEAIEFHVARPLAVFILVDGVFCASSLPI
jgi:hypothetical protein